MVRELTQQEFDAISPEENGLSAGQVMSSAVSNFPQSAKQFGTDIWEAVTNPIQTAENALDLGIGVVQLAIPGEQGNEEKARAVGEFFANRYGGLENVKTTIATDPVGFIADVSMVLTGGGMAAARAPGTLGKIGSVAVKAGGIIDPLNVAAKAGSALGRGVVAPVVGNLGTGTGAESITQSYRAGRSGGEQAKAFRDNISGNVAPEQVVSDAKAALKNMRIARQTEYVNGMDGVRRDATVLQFDPITKAVAEAQGLSEFKGQVLDKSAANVMQEITEEVANWGALDPSEYHTPIGLDALKQRLGDIRENTQPGTRSRVAADRVYNAIKNSIVEQAPEYASAMKRYETASSVLREAEKALSLGEKASIDTTLRKLQSVMRSNVNTNFGQRVKTTEKLEDAGGETIMPALAGQAMASATPRGLQGLTASGALAAGAYFSNPMFAAGLPLQSPRLVGEAAYAAGVGARNAAKAIDAIGPTRARAAALTAAQAGRAPYDENENR